MSDILKLTKLGSELEVVIACDFIFVKIPPMKVDTLELNNGFVCSIRSKKIER